MVPPKQGDWDRRSSFHRLHFCQECSAYGSVLLCPLWLRDLSTGSFLQGFKMQHDPGEEGGVNRLKISMKNKGYSGHVSLRESLK